MVRLNISVKLSQGLLCDDFKNGGSSLPKKLLLFFRHMLAIGRMFISLYMCRFLLYGDYNVIFFTERVGCAVVGLSSSDVLRFRKRSQRGDPENL